MKHQGIGASPGIAFGRALVFSEPEFLVENTAISPDHIDKEIERFEAALNRATEAITRIEEATRQMLGDDKGDIFAAHVLLLNDPEYIAAIKEKVKTEGICATAATQEITDSYCSLFSAIEDPYLRERETDLRDISRRLLRELAGLPTDSLAHLTEPVILFAHDLMPSDMAQLDKSKVVGFATALGSLTSHAVIMARSMELPAVVGVGDITGKVRTGDRVILDGNEGIILLNPSCDDSEGYRLKQKNFEQQQIDLKKGIDEPAVMADGTKIKIAANIGHPADAKQAFHNRAAGIGLYRTEFLYMGRRELPTEEEQFEAYKTVAVLFGTRPVIIRTLDIGGDKELPCLDLPKEKNPFLGYRAIRLCLDRKDLFKTQLRAILRASVYGNVKLMYPMIATLEELQAANEILAEAKEELAVDKIPFNSTIETGIMIEIPAAAVLADQFAKEADFFSIGTNDLIQYTMAADRMSEKVANLYQPLNLAVLRLIQGVVRAAHSQGKHVGLCGEMAGDPIAIPLLVGLGVDELSMGAGSILQARALLRRLTVSKAKSIAAVVMEMNSSREIEDYIKQVLPPKGENFL